VREHYDNQRDMSTVWIDVGLRETATFIPANKTIAARGVVGLLS